MDNFFACFRANWKVISLIFLIVLINSMGLSLIYPLLVPLFLSTNATMLSPHTSTAIRNIDYQLASSIFSLGMVIGTLFWGHISDRFGRKTALLYCLSGSLAGYLLSTLGIHWHSVSLFIFGRLIDGITAATIVVSLAIMIDLEPKQKTALIGSVFGATAWGFTLGPYLSFQLSPISVFIIMSVFCMINLCLFFFLPPLPKQQSKQEKIKQKYNILNPPLKYLMAAFTCQALGWLGFYGIASMMLKKSFGWPAGDISLYYTMLGACMVICFCYLTKFFNSRFSDKSIIYTGTSLCILGFMGLIIFENNMFRWLITVPMVIGPICGFQLYHKIFSDNAKQEIQGIVMGISRSIEALALFITGVTSVWIMSFGWRYMISSCVILLLASLVFFWKSQNIKAKHR